MFSEGRSVGAAVQLTSVGLQNRVDHVDCWRVHEIRGSPDNLKAQLTAGNGCGQRSETWAETLRRRFFFFLAKYFLQHRKNRELRALTWKKIKFGSVTWSPQPWKDVLPVL